MNMPYTNTPILSKKLMQLHGASQRKTKFEQYPFTFPQLKSDEIKANVLYTGLCLSDSLSGRSSWGKANYPLAPGHEIIAEVSEVGADVQDFNKGDKVAFGTMRNICQSCKYCQKGREPLCTGLEQSEKFTYGKYWGGYATQLQQPALLFFKLPQNLNLQNHLLYYVQVSPCTPRSNVTSKKETDVL